MWFDPSTLFVTMVATVAVGGLVLLWSWYEDQSEFLLAWCGLGFLLASVGIALPAAQEHALSQYVSLRAAFGGGQALMIIGTACSWTGARAFNRRPVARATMCWPPIAWLLLCLTPLFDTWFQMATAIGSAFAAFYLLLFAFEIRRGDPLAGRLPLALLAGGHALAMLARIPFVFGFIPRGLPPLHSPWLGPLILEALVFIQVAAVLLLTLTKERLVVRLRHAAEIDPLTGLCNRRAFFERGKEALAICARLEKPAAVVICDLDKFKTINDTYGHAAGDTVLQAFGAAARDSLRSGDIVGRIGGEEFALVLPGCDANAAAIVARKVLDRFSQLGSQTLGRDIVCTASGGVMIQHAGTDTLEGLLNAADEALYQAKRDGANHLRLAR